MLIDKAFVIKANIFNPNYGKLPRNKNYVALEF
jgi:hypothetical protein